MRRGGGGKRGGAVRSDIRVPELNAPARASRCTFRKRHQGTLSGALRSEARRSGVPERVGSPAGAQEGVHRHVPTGGRERLAERPPEHPTGKRGHPLSQCGKVVSSEVTSGCPKRSEGGFPVGTRTITAFPNGTVHPAQNLEWDKRARKRRRLPHGRQRLFR